MTGYVKLHRKLLDSAFRDQPLILALLTNLLLMASHREVKFLWNGKEQVLLPGQLITGRKTLSKETGISEQTIRTALYALKSTNTITIKSTNRFSLISIVNWKKYQDRQPTEQPASQPTVNQQLTTYKNEENEKKIGSDHLVNEKDINYLLEVPSIDLEEYARDYQCTRQQAKEKAESLYYWFIEKGSTSASYKASLRKALLKDFGKNTLIDARTFSYPTSGPNDL
jgi:hypothetical protein